MRFFPFLGREEEAKLVLPGLQISSVQMTSIVTLVVLIAALWVILSNKYDDGTEKWAFASIGSVLTFWLKPGT